MQQKICATCYYDTGSKCNVLREKISKNCYAWADEVEAKKRERDIKEYSEPTLSTAMTDEQKERKRESTERNSMMRGGKSSLEVLDGCFKELYDKGLTDIEIGKKLHVDRNRVHEYRRSKNLKKNRPAPTGTVLKSC